MTTNKRFSYGEAARGYVAGNLPGFLGIGAAFMLLSMIVAALSLVSVLLSVFALLVLLLPFLFAATTFIARIGRGKELPTNRETLQRAIAYFVPPFRGSYRILFNLLKALGFYILGTLLTALVVGLIFRGIDPTFSENFQTMVNDYVQGDYDSLYYLVNGNISLTRWLEWSRVGGTGVGLWALCWVLSDYLMHPLVKSRAIIFPHPAFARAFYNRFFSSVRKQYWKTVFTQGYGIALFPPIFYALGSSLALYFQLPTNAAIAIGIGAVAFMVSLLFPYHLALVEEFFRHQKKPLLETQAGLMDEIFQHYSSIPNVPQEGLDEMKADIDKTKESLQNLDENSVVDEEKED